MRIAGGIGIAKYIGGIAVAPMRGQLGVELLERSGRELGELAAMTHEGIGGERAGAAGIRDDG